jgi:dimethylglycine dehydrogenase
VSQSSLPRHTRVAVIGGGVVGCSVLYHLTKLGWRDVILLERTELTAGSTWHAAGGVHTLNGDPNVAALQAYTIRLYDEIERISGVACGMHRTGAMYLASNDQELAFFKAEQAKAQHLNLALHFISLAEAKQLHPLLDTQRFTAAMFDPNDAHLDPSGVTHAYAKAARDGGAQVFRHTPVTGLRARPSGEWEVTTPGGTIIAEYIVNAAGLWAREVGQLMGVTLPIMPMEHQYVLTNDIPELVALNREVPLLVDFSGANYLRQEGKSFLVGTYEQECKHWSVGGTPLDFGVELLPPDIDRIQGALEKAVQTVPPLGAAGIKRIVNGAMVFSPDGNPIVGPVPGHRNAFLAAGCMMGFSQGGGVGLVVAQWIIDGEPDCDVFGMDVARFGDYATRPYVLRKTEENYRRRFILPCPNEELAAARPLRTSPVYGRMRSAGALFGVGAGWEVPLWFAQTPEAAVETPTFGRSNSFGPVAEECQAVRSAVGIWDTSSYCKIEVRGEGAVAWLDGILANRVPTAQGQIAVCPLLSRRGRLLGDVTAVRTAPDAVLMFGSPMAETHYLRWLEMHRGGDLIQVRSRTSELSGLAVSGPRARELLARVTDVDVSSAALPFLRARTLTVGLATALVLRVSFTGELGYEIYSPPEYLAHIYDALLTAGAGIGVRNFGLRALNSLRLEKSYGAWGREYTGDYTPAEAGLKTLIHFDKPAFIGRDAVMMAPVAQRRLRLLAIESKGIDPAGGEPVFIGGKAVTRLTSAAFGHTVGYAIGMAYLPTTVDQDAQRVEVQVLSERYPARVLAAAPYDPAGARLRS